MINCRPLLSVVKTYLIMLQKKNSYVDDYYYYYYYYYLPLAPAILNGSLLSKCIGHLHLFLLLCMLLHLPKMLILLCLADFYYPLGFS